MIVGVLRGGPSVGQGTLNRFFAAHEAIGGSTIQSTAIGTLYLHGGYVPSRNGMLRNASGTSSRRTSMSVGIGISAHKVVLGFNWVALLVVHVGFQGSGHIQLPSAWHVTVYPGLSYTAGDLETRRFGDSYQPVRLLARSRMSWLHQWLLGR